MKILNFEQRLERAYSEYLKYDKPLDTKQKGENFLYHKGWYILNNNRWDDLRYYSFFEFIFACGASEELRNFFLEQTKILEEINIPEHVFDGIDKDNFLNFIEKVFLKIKNSEKINIHAAISFLKLKFINGDADINSAVIMIQNQCRK